MVKQDARPRKMHVGVLLGGRSGEHEVSLASAKSIMENMDRAKYEVVPIGITKEGEWIVGGDPMKALTSGSTTESSPATLLADPSRSGVWNISATTQQETALQASAPKGEITAVRLAKLDVVFPVLHGTFGEDGTVQGLLELASVPYVGCSVMASAVAMDKAICKEIWRAQGLPVLPFLVLKRKDWQHAPAKVIDRILSRLDYPLFVKPANLGSSVGISKVHNETELAPAVDTAARYDRKIVVEQGIEAREIELSVLGNDDPIVSVPGEVVPSREFYDYRAKYIDDDSELLIPAPLSAEMARQAQEMAIAAYKAIDCAGMARADFLLDKVTGKLWVNELNTIPGFTQISMYPKLWEATGIPYPELIDRLIELAIERFDDQGQSERSFNVETDA
jgi:D-alanine-D-alanine ligase